MTVESLSDVDESELQMALVEWKRWRNRVRHAETMNRRQERYAQACAQIDAIEEEMEFRRTCRQRHRAALVQANLIATEELVSLTEFRIARKDADSIAQRMRRLK